MPMLALSDEPFGRSPKGEESKWALVDIYRTSVVRSLATRPEHLPPKDP